MDDRLSAFILSAHLSINEFANSEEFYPSIFAFWAMVSFLCIEYLQEKMNIHNLITQYHFQNLFMPEASEDIDAYQLCSVSVALGDFHLHIRFPALFTRCMFL